MRSSSPALLATLVGLAVACGGGDAVAEREVVEPLAARADRVAELADTGDLCGADEELSALLAEASAARDAGELAAGVVDELQGAAERMRETGLRCVADSEDEGDEDPGRDGDEGTGNGNGRGRGKAKGRDR